MALDLDIAAILEATAWPFVVLVIFLLYRHKLTAILETLGSKVRKVELAGFSIELAVAEPFTPQWTEAPYAVDLRHRASASQVSDSTARTFISQLNESGRADYAEVNLGTGSEWLTTRLFIMAILFPRNRGIRGFVFLETSGDVRRRYLGWAPPEQVRWALAQRYPWLERAYAEAYAAVLTNQDVSVVDACGTLAYGYAPTEAGPSIELLREFLLRVQNAPAPPDGGDWVTIDPADPMGSVSEHAQWLDGGLLETLLGVRLHRSSIAADSFMQQPLSAQLRALADMTGDFAATTDAQHRFDALIDRVQTLSQAARAMASASPGG